MLLRWVGYIFVALVSVQTFAAAADVHQSHQSGKEHRELQQQLKQKLEQTNQHKPSDTTESIQRGLTQTKSVNQLSDSNVTSAFDCQQCCHCHSCHTHILIRENLPTQNFAYDSNPVGSVNPAQIGFLSLPYRPPRA